MGVAAVIGHGLYHDSLPGWSLTLRWQYWKATAGMIADHFWTGVGRENFGRHYTLYKDIASPEEVSNPHNFFVQAAAEWGVVGLVAVLAMIVGVTRCTARSSRQSSTRAQSEETPKLANYLACLAGLGIVVVLGRASMLGSNDINYVYYSAATTGIIWVPAFVVFFRAGAARKNNRPDVLALALAAGLLAFLLQDMISFALFIPASATTFFALLAVWLSGTPGEQAPKAVYSHRFGRLVVVAIAAGMTTAFASYLLAPVARSQDWREFAESILPDANAIPYYGKAQEADPLDPTSCVEEARWHAASDYSTVIGLALRPLSQAQARDPYRASLFWMESQIHKRTAMLAGRNDDYRAAVQAAKAALALYPQDPAGLVSLADTEMMAGKVLQSKDLLLTAIGHYQEALALDEKRLNWETIQRFRSRIISEIHAKIRSIQLMLHE